MPDRAASFEAHSDRVGSRHTYCIQTDLMAQTAHRFLDAVVSQIPRIGPQGAVRALLTLLKRLCYHRLTSPVMPVK